eukprot:1140514-Prorocentrum_minimum.AAC.1
MAASRPFFKGAAVKKVIPQRGMVDGQCANAWNMDESVFGGRRFLSDSRTFFDSKVRCSTNRVQEEGICPCRPTNRVQEEGIYPCRPTNH